MTILKAVNENKLAKKFCLFLLFSWLLLDNQLSFLLAYPNGNFEFSPWFCVFHVAQMQHTFNNTY